MSYESEIFVNEPSDKAVEHDPNDSGYYAYLISKFNVIMGDVGLPEVDLDPEEVAEVALEVIPEELIAKAKKSSYVEGVLLGFIVGASTSTVEFEVDEGFYD